jgi:hypothetical protein
MFNKQKVNESLYKPNTEGQNWFKRVDWKKQLPSSTGVMCIILLLTIIAWSYSLREYKDMAEHPCDFANKVGCNCHPINKTVIYEQPKEYATIRQDSGKNQSKSI